MTASDLAREHHAELGADLREQLAHVEALCAGYQLAERVTLALLADATRQRDRYRDECIRLRDEVRSLMAVERRVA